jgi:hypothetical protein
MARPLQARVRLRPKNETINHHNVELFVQPLRLDI